MSDHGPDSICTRDTCADVPRHRAGEHLNARSPLYDGPSITINALGHQERKAAYTLIAAGAPVPEVIDLVEKIHFLDRQVAAVRVDKDRQVRAASERALDCADHGEMLRHTEKQAHFFSTQAEANDRARVALLAVLFKLQDTMSALETAARQGKPLPEADKIVTTIRAFLDKASKTHDAAWRKK